MTQRQAARADGVHGLWVGDFGAAGGKAGGTGGFQERAVELLVQRDGGGVPGGDANCALPRVNKERSGRTELGGRIPVLDGGGGGHGSSDVPLYGNAAGIYRDRATAKRVPIDDPVTFDKKAFSAIRRPRNCTRR